MTTDYSSPRRQAGFTLVELLIVAIILAILAAIVVPQFASSTDDAIDSALKSNLANIRGAVDLYRQQHTGVYPGAVASTGGAACAAPATAGGGAAGSQQALTEQLTFYTNAAGAACSVQDPDGDPATANFSFGPYLKADVFPANPVLSDNTVTIVATGDLRMGGADAGGWRYDTLTGRFIADDNGTDASGTAYDTY